MLTRIKIPNLLPVYKRVAEVQVNIGQCGLYIFVNVRRRKERRADWER